MESKSLVLLGALALTACHSTVAPLSPPTESTPPFVLEAPAGPPTPAPTPQLPGMLAPGERRNFTASAETQVPLLVGNPSGVAATLRLEVTPRGEPSPLPGSSPVPPSPTPAASIAPSEGGGPEAVAPPIAPFPLTSGEPTFGAPPGAESSNQLAETRSEALPSAPTGPPPAGEGPVTDTPTGLKGFGRVPPTRRTLEVTGATTTFWINNGDATLAGDRRRDALLRLATPHVAFYVDAEATSSVPDSTLSRLGEAFEQQIRPRLGPVFGEPAVAPGEPIDVVISPWIGQAPNRKGMMGYFWPRDVLAPGGTGADLRQHANQKHVLFLATALLAQPDVTAFGTLAHEYQHLLMFDAKSRTNDTPHTEETWLDEGFAMLAMDIAGYGMSGGDPFVTEEVGAFRRAPAAYSLTDWTHNPHGYSYGLSYLFTRYLADRFGTGIVREVQETPKTGTAGLEAVLAKRGLTFSQVFLDWALVTWRSPDGLTAAHATEPAGTNVRPWGLVPLELDGLPDQSRALALLNDARPLVVLQAPGGKP